MYGEENMADSNFELVKKFMEVYGQEVKSVPAWPESKIVKLRYDLIEEELLELQDATRDHDIVAVADALTDLLYVVYGAGHSYGIDLDRCFREVHRSNMSKLGKDGKPIRNEAGKVMKGPGYSEPDLSFVEEPPFMFMIEDNI
jgi:predicted HAD superfamily Cof-like phosphohydrolase